MGINSPLSNFCTVSPERPTAAMASPSWIRSVALGLILGCAGWLGGLRNTTKASCLYASSTGMKVNISVVQGRFVILAGLIWPSTMCEYAKWIAQ